MRNTNDRLLMMGALVLLTAAYAVAEEVTLTTYYPSPRGVYEEIRATKAIAVGAPLPGSVITREGELYGFGDQTSAQFSIATDNPGVGGEISIGRARGTPGALADIQPDDSIGKIVFTGRRNSQPPFGYSVSSSIEAEMDGAPVGIADVPGRLTFNTVGNGVAQERMRITSAGNVGIGTASPQRRLDVSTQGESSNVTALRLMNDFPGPTNPSLDTEVGVELFATAQNATSAQPTGRIYGAAAPNFADARMTLQSVQAGPIYINTLTVRDGNVGIGTIAPTGPLEVGSNVGVLGNAGLFGTFANGAARDMWFDGGSDGVFFFTNSGPVTGDTRFTRFDGTTNTSFMTIKNDTGNVGIGTTSPGAKLDVVGLDPIAGDLSPGPELFSVTRFGPDAISYAPFTVRRARGVPGPGAASVLNGDAIGGLNFEALAPGGGFITAGKIRADVDGVPVGGNVPGKLVFITNPGDGNPPAQRMWVEADGDVIIAPGGNAPIIFRSVGQIDAARTSLNQWLRYSLFITSTQPELLLEHRTANGTGPLVSDTAIVPGSITVKSNTGVIRVENLGGVGNEMTPTSKTFVIPHPIKPDMRLRHAAIEGPEVGVYYRGVDRLQDGKAVVELPDYFEALTRKEDRTVQLTPIFEGDEPISALAASAVEQGRFQVRGIDERNPSQRFFWEAKAIRGDIPPLVIEEPAAPEPKEPSPQ